MSATPTLAAILEVAMHGAPVTADASPSLWLDVLTPAQMADLLTKHVRTIAHQASALEECEEYLDQRADADCEGGRWTGNTEMRLLQEVRHALGKGDA